MFESGVKPHDLNLCFLSNTQARDENESRITRLPGGKSFFQKPDAKPRAALGSIANTFIVERNAAGKVSSVSTWFRHFPCKQPPQGGYPHTAVSTVFRACH